MFIAIEGVDASGKATQSKLLAKRIKAKLLSFPAYGTPMGDLILRHLKKKWVCTFDSGELLTQPKDGTHLLNAMVFQALHFANRLEKATEILRCLHHGQNVVADRYLASAIVYGGADGLDMDYLLRVQEYLPQPDLNILLNIDPQLSVDRRPDRRDRYETQPGLMANVMKRYVGLWEIMADKEGAHRWKIINGEQLVDDVHSDVIAALLVQFVGTSENRTK